MMHFDEDERRLLAQLADVLIPAGDAMLSASQADVAGHGLDKVLAVRRDLESGLRDLLGKARGREPQDVIEDLRVNDADTFGVLAELVPGAYFMNPDVQRAIGYAGQNPRPIDPRADYMEDGLLESVIGRGSIYRPTPNRD